MNPECSIPSEATLIHGITDLDVQNEPSFKELSNDIYNFIKNSDLAGYNSDRFDIPLLVEEMLRAEDIGNFYKIKPDSRDLNYDNYFSKHSLIPPLRSIP